MKGYRPNVVEQKQRHARRLIFPGRVLEAPTAIKGNSEPWLDHAPRSLADVIAIIERIEAAGRTWHLKSDDFIIQIGLSQRVLLLGGAAMIFHGLSRGTKDIDIWVDPMADAETWALVLAPLLGANGLYAARAADANGTFAKIETQDIARVVNEDRFIRILGADRDIDVFRSPRNMALSDFDQAWERGENTIKHGVKVLDSIDLVLTKMETGRIQDQDDIHFLEAKIEASYRNLLKTCSVQKARELFERFVTPSIAAFAAADGGDPAVRLLGKQLLDDLRDAGDPYAVDLLARIQRRDDSSPRER